MSETHFLNRQFQNNFQELIRYYPRYYRRVREMVAILNASGSLLDVLMDNIEQAYDNCFLDTMDEETLKQLEDFLGIQLNKSRTLEERRRLIKAFFAGFGTVSASNLEELIYAYTGAEVKISFEPFDEWGNNMLIIDIARGDENAIYMSDILYLLGKKIPAHIWYRAELWYDFPGIAVGGGRVRHTNYIIDYKICGTLPENALHGALGQFAVVVEKDKSDVTTDFVPAESDGLVAGVRPEHMLKAEAFDTAVVVKKENEDTLFHYEISEEGGLVSGVSPELLLKGAAYGAAAVVDKNKEDTVYTMEKAGEEPAGVEPMVLKAGVYSEISAETEAQVTVGGVDYIFCGEDYAGTQG